MEELKKSDGLVQLPTAHQAGSQREELPVRAEGTILSAANHPLVYGAALWSVLILIIGFATGRYVFGVLGALVFAGITLAAYVSRLFALNPHMDDVNAREDELSRNADLREQLKGLNGLIYDRQASPELKDLAQNARSRAERLSLVSDQVKARLRQKTDGSSPAFRRFENAVEAARAAGVQDLEGMMQQLEQIRERSKTGGGGPSEVERNRFVQTCEKNESLVVGLERVRDKLEGLARHAAADEVAAALAELEAAMS